MVNKRRTVGSIKSQLLKKAREASLCAIKIFNDPLVSFKSESFIVLMVIAWTYLLHAYYRTLNINYRYYSEGEHRKKYIKTKSGAKKHWELERCLNYDKCPINTETKKNLLFLIGLRHEIEHQMTNALDNYLSGRYQACAFNFNDYIKRLFGVQYGLDPLLTYSIQFADINESQLRKTLTPDSIPSNILTYIIKYDESLTDIEFNSPHFSYRLLFTRKLVNRPGQADKVIEFIDPGSDLAKTINREYWFRKDTERPKYRAKDVVAVVNKTGFTKFRVQPEHLRMWRTEDAKNPAKGYGTNVAGYWFWYESWIQRCIELCRIAGDKFK